MTAIKLEVFLMF